MTHTENNVGLIINALLIQAIMLIYLIYMLYPDQGKGQPNFVCLGFTLYIWYPPVTYQRPTISTKHRICLTYLASLTLTTTVMLCIHSAVVINSTCQLNFPHLSMRALT